MKKDITILQSWGWKDIYHIDWNIKDYMNMKTQAKQNWEDWFWSEKYQTFIKFASLEKEQGKTQYLSIEATKQEFKESTPEEREKFEKFKHAMLKETYEWRKRKFHEKRKEILEQLARDEKRFELETTLDKLLELEAIKLKQTKESLKN